MLYLSQAIGRPVRDRQGEPMGTAAELSQSSEKLMNRVTSGQIGLSDAKGTADLLAQHRHILETENLEKRIRAIEQETEEKEK